MRECPQVTIEKLRERNAELETENAKLKKVVQTVYDDCQLRKVDGVVPLGNSTWYLITEALGDSEHE